MSKLFLIIILVLGSVTAMAKRCDEDTVNSINSHISDRFCHKASKSEDFTSSDARAVFAGYFEKQLCVDELEINASSNLSYEDYKYTSVILSDSRKTIYIEYEVRSNNETFEVDQHNICVVKSCDIVEKQ